MTFTESSGGRFPGYIFRQLLICEKPCNHNGAFFLISKGKTSAWSLRKEDFTQMCLPNKVEEKREVSATVIFNLNFM